jgi:hypothetical protein
MYKFHGIPITYIYVCVIVVILVVSIGIFYIRGNLESFKNSIEMVELPILYINLDNRKDRKRQLLDELDKLGIPASSIHRIPGVFMPKNGHKGCVRSHLKALDAIRQNNWPYALILEDDFELAVSPAEFNKRLADLLKRLDNMRWDVIMLATAYAKKEPTTNLGAGICRIRKATTASAYIVNSAYVAKLAECFEYCDANMSEDKIHDVAKNFEIYALDQQWANLQARDAWYGFTSDISKQRDNTWSSTETELAKIRGNT